MKKKGLTALALVSALMVLALIPAAFAETPSTGSDTETAVRTVRKQPGGHGGGEQGEKSAEPENAIGRDAAKAAALADAGVTAEQAGKVKAHVSQLEDGTVLSWYALTIKSEEDIP